MHILINETRPCQYKRHGIVCGKPAIHLHGPNNEPRCTLCDVEAARHERAATLYQDAAESRRERAADLTRATGEAQTIDTWEPARYAVANK